MTDGESQNREHAAPQPPFDPRIIPLVQLPITTRDTESPAAQPLSDSSNGPAIQLPTRIRDAGSYSKHPALSPQSLRTTSQAQAMRPKGSKFHCPKPSRLRRISAQPLANKQPALDTHMDNTSPAFRPASDDEMLPEKPLSLQSSQQQASQQQASSSSTAATSGAQDTTLPKVQVHKETGYTWTKDEDAPGYSWKRRAAVRDTQLAWESIVDRDLMIGNKYGDIGLEEMKAKLRWTTKK